MHQNRSPLYIVTIVSILISVLTTVSLIIYDVLTIDEINLSKYFFFISFTFLFSFLCVRYFIKKYISAKLNPIYSLVRKKPGEIKDLKNVNLNRDVFGNLNGEVKEWMDNKNKEIQSIKNLEQYRKDYVGNISHELKTPLTSVQGYIHTLLEDVEDPVIRRKFIQKAANNTERLIQIVDDLETITKIESGNNIIELHSFNLKEVMEEVLEDLEFMTHEKNVKLQFIDGNMSSYNAYGDKEAIRQVLNNLIVNSIKYGKEGGTSTVKFYDMIDNFLIEVNDDGQGIDAQHLPHIFDRFYRVDKSRNRNIGGSGLGLAIVKHLIEAHHQTIHVKSIKGKGSSFSFTLKKSHKN